MDVTKELPWVVITETVYSVPEMVEGVLTVMVPVAAESN
jgi:hypothetical protein